MCYQTCDNLPPKLTPYDPHHHLTVRSVKLVMDGALGSWGAAMIEPYSDARDKVGLVRIPRERITGLVWEIMQQDYQVNVHCIGDLANKLVLDAFETNHQRWDEEHGKTGHGGRALRSRIEHAQIMRAEDVERFGRVGVLPSVQPTHGGEECLEGMTRNTSFNPNAYKPIPRLSMTPQKATSDMSYAELRLGPRARNAYIWRSFLEGQGVPHLPLGSDFPIEDVDPMKGVYSAVTRKFADGSSPHNDTDGWFPAEKLTRFQALRGFTLSAAYAAFQDDVLGSITQGKLADFVVYEKDWVSEEGGVTEGEILTMKPAAVFVGGVKRFGTV
ncbi:hypothetical protein HDU67_003753 [Dinochytrium kinnereticum]|nr:hypothetical protein HDU67_003753 [Dinochytrium kinnereticum]